ncbi:MAG: D-alanyl-D-alanine carboxypeptidase [Oscillospiraceae bacterium]|nr:D-alanyl-D-alanine carboxypeptidase [Oscillospiraceae bacterium]
MKKAVAIVLSLILLTATAFAAGEIETTAGSYVLMEKTTGQVLLEENSHEPRPIASVTKIMTLLLVMEAIDSGALTLDTTLTAGAHACSMGGSQIYLEEGEQMTCEELLKSVVVASANDAAVVFAEHIAGSEASFVEKMNEKAAQLGMDDTTFKNCTGLPEEGHLSSAMDVAIMSAELLKYDLIKNYTTIWMDTVRDGQFGLANTNKLVKSYNGITGLKTGFTADAMFCVSATAQRDGMELISVVLGASTGDDRFSTAAGLLDWGFANFTLCSVSADTVPESIPVSMGIKDEVKTALSGPREILIEKNRASALEINAEICDDVCAPVAEGQVIGTLTVTSEGQLVAALDIVAAESVPRLTFSGIFKQGLHALFTGVK